MDNAHIQEKQIQQEKKELRLELYREREIRENLERQLAVELQSRSKFNKLTITEIVNIVLEIFSVVIDILYILREKDIYENHKDAVSIRVGWIHPANLSTSKNTKVYFLLTLLIYLWFAETQSEKSAPSSWTLLVSLRDKLGTLKAGVGKHIL